MSEAAPAAKAPRFRWERLDERKGAIRDREGKPLWSLVEFTERARVEGVGWMFRTVRRWALLIPPYTLREVATSNVLRDADGAWDVEVLPDVAEEQGK